MAIIYLLDTDRSLRKSLQFFLNLDDHVAIYFESEKDLTKKFEATVPDLLIVDPLVENFTGYNIVKKLKKFYTFQFIFLSSLSSESDKILGLELGAEDFITKPISVKEIYLRIRNILKNNKSENANNRSKIFIYNGKTLKFNYLTQTFFLDGKKILLTKSQWKILSLLCDNAQVGVSRDKISTDCLNTKINGYERVVDNHIKNIRKVLQLPGLIVNIRGFGFMFCGELHKNNKNITKNT